MNSTSLAFALGMAALVAVTGWFIDWGAGRYGGWSMKRRWMARFLTLIATGGVGVFVYQSDVRLRGTTLFEVAGPWAETGGCHWTVEVEHPGIEHHLMVYPFSRGFESAGHPVTLRTRFAEKDGVVLLEETVLHETKHRTGKHAAGFTWADATWSFTPKKAGPHDLLVESVDGAVPFRLHLRISDPQKRNGKRAPGY